MVGPADVAKVIGESLEESFVGERQRLGDQVLDPPVRPRHERCSRPHREPSVGRQALIFEFSATLCELYDDQRSGLAVGRLLVDDM